MGLSDEPLNAAAAKTTYPEKIMLTTTSRASGMIVSRQVARVQHDTAMAESPHAHARRVDCPKRDNDDK